MADYTQIGSDGSVERYHDPYALVTQEQIDRADELEQEILDRSAQIEVSYIRLAGMLSQFRNEKLYLAKGWSTFQEWANSPDLKRIGYRTAQNLVRIADELLPLLLRHDVEDFPPISTMYDLLPMLADGNEEAIIEAVQETRGLNTRDAKERIKELRGITSGEQPIIFKAQVREGNDSNTVTIYCDDPGDFYKVGTLSIKKKHWARWTERFNERFITYET